MSQYFNFYDAKLEKVADGRIMGSMRLTVNRTSPPDESSQSVSNSNSDSSQSGSSSSGGCTVDQSAVYINRHWWIPGGNNQMWRPYSGDWINNDMPACVCISPVLPEGDNPNCATAIDGTTGQGDPVIEENAIELFDRKWARCYWTKFGGMVYSEPNNRWGETKNADHDDESGESSASSTGSEGSQNYMIVRGTGPGEVVIYWDGQQYFNVDEITDDLNSFLVQHPTNGESFCVFPIRCSGIASRFDTCPYDLPRYITCSGNELSANLLPKLDPNFDGEITNNVFDIPNDYFENPDPSRLTRWSTSLSTFIEYVTGHQAPYEIFFAGNRGCCFSRGSWDTGRYSNTNIFPPPYPQDAGITGQDFVMDWIICVNRTTERDFETNAIDPDAPPFTTITVSVSMAGGEGTPILYGTFGQWIVVQSCAINFELKSFETETLGAEQFTIPFKSATFPSSGFGQGTTGVNDWVDRTPFEITGGSVIVTIPGGLKLPPGAE